MTTSTNVEIKDLLGIVFNGVNIGEDVLNHNWFSIVGNALSLVGDVPGAIANVGDIKNELEALATNPSAQSDLIIYVEGLFPSIPKATVQSVLGEALSVLSGIFGLVTKASSLKTLIAAAKK
jgi:hypothetical protein